MRTALIVAFVVGVVLFNLLLAWAYARRDVDVPTLSNARDAPTDATTADRGASPAGDTVDDPPPLDVDRETVFCRHCGARNRAGYRYCRWCVRSGFVEEGDDAAGRSVATRRPL